jgi:hypothetical protein
MAFSPQKSRKLESKVRQSQMPLWQEIGRVIIAYWCRKNAFLVPVSAILNTRGLAKTSTYVKKRTGSMTA